MKELHIEGTRFLDKGGRQVLMNGWCFICRECMTIQKPVAIMEEEEDEAI